MTPLYGGCLCQKVRYKISSPPISQGICYCRQCQKVSGTYGSPVMVLQKNIFECSQQALSFCITKSARDTTVARNFCKECGSHIFAEISDVPELLTIKAGTLDDCSLFDPEYLVWTRSAAPSCIFPAGVPFFPENAPLEVLLGTSYGLRAI